MHTSKGVFKCVTTCFISHSIFAEISHLTLSRSGSFLMQKNSLKTRHINKREFQSAKFWNVKTIAIHVYLVDECKKKLFTCISHIMISNVPIFMVTEQFVLHGSFDNTLSVLHKWIYVETACLEVIIFIILIIL